jgi:hypothetical protein
MRNYSSLEYMCGNIALEFFHSKPNAFQGPGR